MSKRNGGVENILQKVRKEMEKEELQKRAQQQELLQSKMIMEDEASLTKGKYDTLQKRVEELERHLNSFKSKKESAKVAGPKGQKRAKRPQTLQPQMREEDVMCID